MSFNRASMSVIRTYAERAGIEWPADLDADLAQVDSIEDSQPQGDRAAVAAAVYNAVQAGNDPVEDDDVKKALLRYLLSDAVPGTLLRDVASNARFEAARRHAPTIIERLQDAVAKHAATLDETRKTLPDFDPYDRLQPSGASPDQAKAWARGRDAADAIEAAVKVWKLLAVTLNLAEVGANYKPLVVADLNAEQLNALQGQHDLRDVIAAGHPLNLATPDEYRARIDRVLHGRTAITQKQDATLSEGYQRMHGLGKVTTGS